MPRTKRVARKSLSTKEEIIDTENVKPTNKVSNTRAKRKAVDSDDTHSAKENPVKRNPKMILNDLTELLEKGRQNLHVSAVPDKLSEREVEFEKIRALVEDALVKKKGSSIYISGVPGTGKTETVRRVLKDLEAVSVATRDQEYGSDEDDIEEFKYLEINGMRLTDPQYAYSLVWKLITPKAGNVAPLQAQTLLEKYFSSQKSNKKKNIKKMYVVILDELDLMIHQRQTVVYNFLNWPTKSNSNLIVISIANTMDLPERQLSNKITSRAGLNRINFAPYTWQQLNAILKDRVGNLNIFEDVALEMCARKVGALSGDARRTLDIARRSIELSMEKSTEKKVAIDSVTTALNEMFVSASIKMISSFSFHQKIFLYSVVSVFKSTGLFETTFNEVSQRHFHLCTSRHINPPSFSILGSICVSMASSSILIAEGGLRADMYQKIRLNVSTDDIMIALKLDERINNLFNLA